MIEAKRQERIALVEASEKEKARQAQAERAEAEQAANERLQQSIYVQLIGAAQRYVESRQLGLAEEKLAECPIHLRGWEWYHLMGSRQTNVIDLKGHSAPIMSVALSNNGRYLASGGSDDFLRLWDTVRREEVWTIESSSDIWCVTFSNDGRYLAATIGQTTRIWRLSNRLLVTELRGHEQQVTCVAFGPNGNRIASASIDGTARLWDVRTGRELAKFEGHVGEVLRVSFNPAGTQVASGDEKNVSIWDVESGQRIHTLRGSRRVNSIAFGPDGQVISSNYHGDLLLWDLRHPGKPRLLPGHLPYTSAVTFQPDGGRLVTVGVDGGVKIRFPNGNEISTLSLRDASTISFSADQKHLAAASFDGSIRIWTIPPDERDTKPKLVRSLSGHSRTILDLEFSADGRKLASVDRNSTARLWDVGGWHLLHEFKPAEMYLGALAFNHDSQILALSGNLKQGIFLFDVDSGKELKFKHQVPARLWPDFSPNGYLVVGNYQGQIEFWNLETTEMEKTLPKESTRWVQNVAFSRDGRFLAGCHNTFVSIWDAESGATVHRLAAHEHVVMDAEFSPNGSQLASTGLDGTVRLWDCATGKLMKTHYHHFPQCWHLSYSPDGRFIAAGGLSVKSGRVVVWNTATGNEVFVLEQDGPSVAFGPNGRFLATGGNDSKIHVWDVEHLRNASDRIR